MTNKLHGQRKGKLKVLEIYEVVNGVCKGWETVSEYWTILEIREFLAEDTANMINLDTGSTAMGRDYSLNTFELEYEEEIKIEEIVPEVYISNLELRKTLVDNIKAETRYVDMEDAPEMSIVLSVNDNIDGNDVAKYVMASIFIDGELSDYDYELARLKTTEDAVKHVNKAFKHLNRKSELSMYLSEYNITINVDGMDF